MTILAFRHEEKRPIDVSEPRIEYEHGDEEYVEGKEIPRRKVIKFTILFLLFSAILYVILSSIDFSKKEVEKPGFYQVCHEQDSMKYRDKTDGKVRVLEGYSYCDSYPIGWGTGNGYGSCVDTGCLFVEDQQQVFERRTKEIGLIHFIK